jgi:RHS repeat-associated protein
MTGTCGRPADHRGVGRAQGNFQRRGGRENEIGADPICSKGALHSARGAFIARILEPRTTCREMCGTPGCSVRNRCLLATFLTSIARATSCVGEQLGYVRQNAHLATLGDAVDAPRIRHEGSWAKPTFRETDLRTKTPRAPRSVQQVALSFVFWVPIQAGRAETTTSFVNGRPFFFLSENFAATNTGPAVFLNRTFDSYGKLTSDDLSGGAAYNASQAWDSAGRRIGLGIGSGGYGFSWRADGLLLGVSGGTAGIGSYNYDTAGQLLTRNFPPRATSVTQRDGNGRPLAVNTATNGVSVFSETLGWTPDGLLATHTIQRPDFTDSRGYTYANQSRRLTQEIVGLSSTAWWTNAFAYDYGTNAGPGVLTHSGQAAGSNVVWSAATDGFSRVNVASNSVAQRQAYGVLNGTASMSALLDGKPVPVTTVGSNDFYEWRAQLALQPGTHQLSVYATNWSGVYTASATNTFTSNAADHVQNAYAGNGEVTSRVWISSGGTTNATQNLSWDARDRLHSVSYLDSNNNGCNWSAIYDGLGRRLATTTIFVTNGVTVSSLPKTISQYFDPNVRFLELGETDNGVTSWKFYGPDLNGVYGGMQGVGGLDAVVSAPSSASPVVSDIRGNGYAIYNFNANSLSWYSSRVTAYGAVEGYRPLPLGDGAAVAPVSAWRGKWADITGLYWLGNRYYDPIAGNWLGADPLGHDADPSLYSFCGGDPVNSFDSDGCLGTKAAIAATVGDVNGPSKIGLTINPNVFPAQLAFQPRGEGPYIPDAPSWDPTKPSTYSIQSLNNSVYQEFFLEHVVARTVEGAATMLAGQVLGFAATGMLEGAGVTITAEGALTTPGSVPLGFTRLELQEGSFVNRVYDSSGAPGTSRLFGQSFSPGSGLPTDAASAITSRGLNPAIDNAQLGGVFRINQSMTVYQGTALGGTAPELFIPSGLHQYITPVLQNVPIVP